VSRIDTRPAGADRLRAPVLIASGLGTGFSRLAPGTVGSLAALVPGAFLVGHTGLLLAAIMLACLAGFWAIPRASGGADHGWVVIDEVAGQWITLLGIPARHNLIWIAAAFLMFRLLDITKPGPIGRLDRRHDEIGVMGDDMLAGVAGALLLAAAGWLLRLA